MGASSGRARAQITVGRTLNGARAQPTARVVRVQAFSAAAAPFPGSYLRAADLASEIALWGRSMGAASCILAASKDPLIAGLVLDSPFASLKHVAIETGGFSPLRNGVAHASTCALRRPRAGCGACYSACCGACCGMCCSACCGVCCGAVLCHASARICPRAGVNMWQSIDWGALRETMRNERRGYEVLGAEIGSHPCGPSRGNLSRSVESHGAATQVHVRLAQRTSIPPVTDGETESEAGDSVRSRSSSDRNGHDECAEFGSSRRSLVRAMLLLPLHSVSIWFDPWWQAGAAEGGAGARAASQGRVEAAANAHFAERTLSYS